MAAKKAKYKALTRLRNKAGDVIAQAGEVTDKIPAESIPWLLAKGYIEPATAKED